MKLLNFEQALNLIGNVATICLCVTIIALTTKFVFRIVL